MSVASLVDLIPSKLILIPFNVDAPLFVTDPKFVRITTEKMEGVDCVKIASAKQIAWLKDNHEYLPIRHDLIENSNVVSSVIFRHVSKSAHGFPIDGWEQKVALASGRPLFTITASITKFVPNPRLSDGDFAIDLEPGTWVSDQAKDKRFLIRPDGTHRPILPGEFTGTNYNELLVTDPPKPPSRSTRFVWVTAALLFIIAVAAFLWRRRRV
jgi:hypothetical protein